MRICDQERDSQACSRIMRSNLREGEEHLSDFPWMTEFPRMEEDDMVYTDLGFEALALVTAGIPWRSADRLID